MPPRPSGRCGTMFDSTARTVRGIQPARNGTWQTCMPRSPMQPYSPLNSTIRFQFSGFVGSRSLECRKPALTSMIRPKAAGLDHPPDPLHGGKEGKLRRAAHEDARDARRCTPGSRRWPPGRCRTAFRPSDAFRPRSPHSRPRGADCAARRNRPHRPRDWPAARGSPASPAGSTGSCSVYQGNSSGLASQTATISGRTSISGRWHHRAAALANSRPIRPQPMIPKRNAFHDAQHPNSFSVFADRLVDDVQALQQRLVVHHDRRAHPQDVAGGNPGQALAERLLIDQLARLVERRLRRPGP